MSKTISDDTLRQVQAEMGTIKRFYKLRPRFGNPAKAAFVTAAMRFAAEMAETRRLKLEDGAFVEVRK